MNPVFFALSPLIIGFPTLFIVMLWNICLAEYNHMCVCKECGIASRKGIVKLNSVNSNTDTCPHCNSKNINYSSDISNNIKLPLAPKLNVFKRIRINQAIKNSHKNKIVDSQLEKYQALQQKKLNEMLDKGIEKMNDYK